MLSVLAVAASVRLVAQPPPPLPFEWIETPGAAAVAVALLWEQGLDDAEVPGVAAVLAECRLLRARRAVPELQASGQLFTGDATIVFGLLPAAAVNAPAEFARALLDDAAPIDDDTLALLVARAALAADDAEFLYPGTVLESQARRTLAVGNAARAALGSASAIAAMTPAVVRARLLRPVAVRGAALGAGEVAARAAMAAVTWPVVARVPLAPQPVPAEVPAAAMAVDVNDRIDGPFVAAAFVPPPPDQWPVFAVAVEVAKVRAARQLRLRGREVLGRAPLVRWSWLEADPVLLFLRRGFDGRALLPGEIAGADAMAEAGAARRELESLLGSLRDEPPTAAEIAAAQRLLQAELGLPTGDALRQLGSLSRALPGRLENWLLARHRGIEVPAVAAVEPADVGALLRRVLADGRAAWHALLPVARADRGWSAR